MGEQVKQVWRVYVPMKDGGVERITIEADVLDVHQGALMFYSGMVLVAAYSPRGWLSMHKVG